MTGTRGKVLVIDDSADMGALLAQLLGDEGFEPVLCETAAAGVEAFKTGNPVAVCLDWVLPDRAGVDVCRELRQQNDVTPIIFISARDDEVSAVRGLDAGADDYVIKPFRHRELIARLEANIRKAELARRQKQEAAVSEPAAGGQTYRVGQVEVDGTARQVRVAGRPIKLGPLEFQLLEYMVRNAGVALSRDQILTAVYGYTADISTERVDVLFRRLRSKLGEGPEQGDQLVAVPGYGYRLDRRSRSSS
jgi:two-component system response regulator MtrA